MLVQLFSPTEKRIMSKSDLMRVGDWTTNRYWLILTSFEPDCLLRLKTTIDTQPDLSKVFKDIDIKKLYKLQLTENIKIIGKTLSLELKVGKDSVFANVYYITMFLKAFKHIQVTFHIMSHDTNKIIVLSGDIIVGIIMGISQ